MGFNFTLFEKSASDLQDDGMDKQTITKGANNNKTQAILILKISQLTEYSVRRYKVCLLYTSRCV